MIKVATAKDALDMLRKGKDIYYFDIETKEIAPLSKVLESVPGAYLVEDSGEPIEINIPTASTHQDYGIPVEPEEPKTEEPKGKPIRKNIDKGKVKALHRAGWSTNKIADEMGVSAATISYHLKKMKGGEE